jgi:hypothetical protein
MPLPARDRSELGRIGALSRLANENATDMTQAARDRQNSTGPGSRWYEATDPELPEPERERRAKAARDAHMAKMRLARSAAVRKTAAAALAERSLPPT